MRIGNLNIGTAWPPMVIAEITDTISPVEPIRGFERMEERRRRDSAYMQQIQNATPRRQIGAGPND